MEVDFESINRGFSKQSLHYDEEDLSNPILVWMRNRVRKHVERYLKPYDRILELNAGTGLDATYFAKNGFRVHATDLSKGMVNKINEKITTNNLAGLLTAQQLSFTELEHVINGPFQYLFSNFGGLNCVPDLNEITWEISKLLTVGAYVTLVIMPPVCPWEILSIFKGNGKLAFRRFNKKGSLAQLEGEEFLTWYFSPTDVTSAFGNEFRVVALEGLASVCPPPYKKQFAVKYPALFKMLSKMDEGLSNIWPFNRWADHFIITLQYAPAAMS
jgi:2-polyprenyl-3-methyl-5-hydroxy-6-metoxy-1,4-benzoquinol methylase